MPFLKISTTLKYSDAFYPHLILQFSKNWFKLYTTSKTWRNNLLIHSYVLFVCLFRFLFVFSLIILLVRAFIQDRVSDFQIPWAASLPATFQAPGEIVWHQCVSSNTELCERSQYSSFTDEKEIEVHLDNISNEANI